jgi:uncharacterized protein involved in exopolysaccharide biosynthesis
VSPVYLDLLHTYEVFAFSDDLFLRALKKFGLDPRAAPERLKHSILKVTVPRNTKVLEISATLRDPRKAQAMALYVAEETVNLTRGANVDADQELTTAIEKQLVDARARVERINSAWRQMQLTEPLEGLNGRIESLEGLRVKLQQELLTAQLNIADGEDRERTLAQGTDNAAHLVVTREQLRSDRLRAERLHGQIAALEREIQTNRELLANRAGRHEELAAERKSAQAALDATENHLREARAFVGYRGERLRVIDPGVVPSRPSSPNIPLNIAAAILMGLILAVVLVSIEFSYRLYKEESLRQELRTGRTNG